MNFNSVQRNLLKLKPGPSSPKLRRIFARSLGICALILTTLLMPVDSRADRPGPFGLGIVLGDPTGVSANYELSSQRSVDAALAWAFGSETGFSFHSDYLWHRADLFQVDGRGIHAHYGLGGRLININNRSEDKTRLGLRLPAGLNFDVNRGTLQFFAEIALIMNLLPKTSTDADFGIGVRVYF